jgi:hypothetical protein
MRWKRGDQSKTRRLVALEPSRSAPLEDEWMEIAHELCV